MCVLCCQVRRSHEPQLLLKRLIAYVTMSAIIGTQSVLLAKSCSELIRTSIAGENQFNSPFTYLIIMAWFATMAFC